MQVKKCLSAFLAAAVIMNTGAFDAMAAENRADTKSINQVVSETETVYVNSYGTGERSVSFNDNWRFYLGELNGAQAVSYNDASWKNVDLPHDYSIDQGYSTAAPAEQESGYVLGGTGWYRKAFTLSEDIQGKTVSVDFDGVYMNATVYLNGEQLGTHPYGYTPFSFVLPDDKLYCDGRENVLAVKVEHKQPSSRWYSGSGIYRDVKLTVTDPVHVAYYGTTVTTPDIKQGTGTVNVVTSVKNESGEAKQVSVRQTVYEKGAADAVVTGEKTAAQSVAAGAESKIETAVTVANPKLWSVDTPNLYTVRTEVYVDDAVVDTYDSEFGFRWVEFTKDNGFFLNGKNMKLRGVSMHHDQGGLGSEAWHRAIERQVEMLQQMGVNAIRVTHNPASQVLIDICNEKGVLLVEEAFDCWLSGKAGNKEDYGKWFEKPIEDGNQIVGGTAGEQWAEFDLKSMIKRGKNAPSIIMWSLGNEVFQQLIESSMNSRFPDVAKQLIQWTAQEDATRYVTFGDNQFKGNESNSSNVATKTARVFAGASDLGVPGGLPGYNYGSSGQIANGHNQGWMVYGSETASSINSRGVYDRKDNGSDGGREDKRLTSYDKSAVSWGHTASDALWITMRQAFNAGEFVWTGFDYIGEPTPDNWQGTGANGTWPNIAKNSYFGIIDTAGFPKDCFYLYQSQWNDKLHTLHVLPVWNQDEIVIDSSGNVEVVVYSDAPVIKLYLNGEEVGTATAKRTNTPTGGYQNYTEGTGCFDKSKAGSSSSSSLYATFNVPYEEGKLEAKAFDEEDNEIKNTDGRSFVETTKRASKLTAKADRTTITADGKDLSYITIDVTDADGKFVNGAEPEIEVSVEGDGVFMALDNGVQNDVTAHGEKTRKAGKGKLLAIVQSTKNAGSFTVTAKAAGYTSASVTVQTEEENTEPVTKSVASYEISRQYYIKEGVQPTLPESVKINYTDGTSDTKAVTWEALPTNPEAVYTVYGTVADENLRISVYVTTIGEVTAILNYSAAVGKDSNLSLPAARPAVMADGSVHSAEFPVTWNIPADMTGTVGTKEIKGTADVFGENFDVTASVRVTAGGYIDGDEALPNVPEMYVNGMSSRESDSIADVLAKLKDDKVSKADIAWSGRGTLDFRLDTAIELKDITLYLKDVAPTSDTMKIYSSSDSGANWTQADCKISNKREDGVTVRTFTPNAIVSETWFRVEFTKNTTLLELEMNTRIPTFPVGEDASLSYLKVGGHTADAATLAKGWFGVTEDSLTAADVKAVGRDNASVTVLPKDAENVVRILLESEDHSERNTYKVMLGEDNTKNDNAEDDSQDYPYNKMTLTAISWHGDEPPAKANDGSNSTIWHSRWGSSGSGETNLTNLPKQRYLQIELDSAQTVNGLRYRPRSSDKNGIVLKYAIKVSETSLSEDEWYALDSVAEGNWSTAVEWKLARFNPVNAKYIRLYGIETSDNNGNAANQYMSAAEVRIRNAKKELYDGNTTVSFTDGRDSLDYTGEELRPELTVVYKASANEAGITLTKDTDYEVSYQNNTDPGTAKAVITGIGAYTGVLEKEFTIKAVDINVTGYEPVKVTTEQDVYPELPGTVLANTNIGQEVKEVRWDRISSSRLHKFGTFTVYGTVLETKAQVTAEVTVADVIGIRQTTLTAAKGSTPVMPEKVLVYYSNGETARRDVAWDMSGVSFTREGIVKITGTVGKSQTEAYVRVETPAKDSSKTPVSKNFALNADGVDKSTEWPRTFAYISSKDDLAHHATDGVKDFVSGTGKRIWSDWESGQYHTNDKAEVGANDHLPFVASAFGVDGTTAAGNQKRYKVNKVRIGFMEEDGTGAHKVCLPQDYKIEYYSADSGVIDASRLSNGSSGASGGCSGVKTWAADNPIKAHTGWTEVKYLEGGKPAVPSSDDFKYMVDVEFEAVETTAVRIVLTPKAENWTGLEEFEVYYEPVARNNSYEVTAINVDGQNLLDRFNKETKTIELNTDDAVITAEADSNASVTVLKAVNGVAKIIFLPENGNEEEKQEYTVKFRQTSQTDQKHLVTAEDDWIEIEGGEASAGETVVFRAKEGYVIEGTPGLVKSTDRTTANIAVTAGEDGSYSFTMPDYPVTVTGETGLKSYQITYELDGGEAENKTEYTIESNPFTLKKPVKEGFVFTGWTGNGITEPEKNVTVATGTTGNLKFTAHWREGITYYITFDSDGGTEVKMQEVSVDSAKVTEPQAPKKLGYELVGWYKDAGKTKVWDFENDTADSDMTLYAKWQEAEITINTHIARFTDREFRVPEYLSVTAAGETFDTDVIWNEDEVNDVLDMSDTGSCKLTGILPDLGGREIEISVPAAPGGIVYFVDCGASVFTTKGQYVADANVNRIQNKNAKGEAVPDGEYSAETGWGFTNDPSHLEASGSGDAYGTIRNLTKAATGETLAYRFDNLKAGNYTVTMGFRDPWAQWANDGRPVNIRLKDQENQVLASKDNHMISTNKQTVSTTVSFNDVQLAETGSVTLEIVPVKSGDSNDPMISFIVIQSLDEVPVTDVKLKDDEVTLYPNGTYQIKSLVLPEDATDDLTLTYTSSDESVVQVSAEGLITAVEKGTATITVDSVQDGVSASMTVTVKEAVPIQEIHVEETEKTIKAGETYQINASVLPENTTDPKTLTYTSSDEKVAAVDADGLVTAMAEGSATITISCVRSGVTANVDVTVTKAASVPEEKPITSIRVNKTEKRIKAGETYQIEASVAPADTTDDKTLTYTSSNEEAATVDENGLVTAVAKGTAQIQITCVRSGITAEVVITVAGEDAADTEDFEKLESEVKKLEKDYADLSKYTSTSAEEFKKALVAANAVLSNPDATKAEIDTALQELAKAKNTLKLNDEGEKKPQLPKAGETFAEGILQYQVTKSDAVNGTVKVVKLLKKSKKVVIPASVSKNSYTFKVTEVDKEVFQKNNQLKEVVFGANIAVIGAKSFFKCKKLKKITFEGTKAPKAGSKAFNGIKKTAKVMVPKNVSKKELKKFKKTVKSAGKKVSVKKQKK